MALQVQVCSLWSMLLLISLWSFFLWSEFELWLVSVNKCSCMYHASLSCLIGFNVPLHYSLLNRNYIACYKLTQVWHVSLSSSSLLFWIVTYNISRQLFWLYLIFFPLSSHYYNFYSFIKVVKHKIKFSI